MKEIILPAIEKEVNAGKNFAPLRQIYYSLILAKWYKETVKQSILSQVYIDQNKVSGLEFQDASTKEKIYAQYLEAYKKGVYNYMKEEYDQLSQTVIPRQYFSGGFSDSAMLIKRTDAAKVVDEKAGNNFVVGVDVRAEEKSSLTRREFLGVTAKAAGAVVLGALVGVGTPSVSQAVSKIDKLDSSLEMLNRMGIFIYRNTDPSLEKSVIEAINIFGERGGDKAVEALLNLLRDENDHVRAETVKALNKLQVSKERLVDGYLDVLKVNSYFARHDAVEALGNLGDKRAVEPLLKDLGSQTNRKLALLVIEALGKLKDERAIPVLLEKLIDRDAQVQQAVKEMLIQLHVSKERLVDGYIAVFKKGYLDAMENAAKELGESGDRRAVDILILNYRKHHFGNINDEIENALRKLGVDPDSVYLRKLWLKHPYAISAMGTVGGIGIAFYTGRYLWDHYTVRGNINILDHQEFGSHYRGKARDFLLRHQSPRIVEKLFRKMEVRSVNYQIEDMISYMIRGYSFEKLQKLMRFKSLQARIIIMRALANLKDERVDDFIIAGVNDENNFVRRAALERLPRTKSTQKFESFLKGLTDMDDKIRKLSAEALGDMKNPQANDELIIRLSDSAEVRTAARNALDKINGPSFIPDLEQSNDPRKIYVLLGLLRRNVDPDLINRFEEEIKTSFVGTLWARIKSEAPNVQNERLYYEALGEAILLREQGYDFALRYQPYEYHDEPSFFDVSSMSMMSEATVISEDLKISISKPISPEKDKAVLADNNDVGGIDMNNIEVKKQGQGASIQFDPMNMDTVIKENIQGFVPVIINVTPVNSILPILGLESSKDKVDYKVSQLN